MLQLSGQQESHVGLNIQTSTPSGIGLHVRSVPQACPQSCSAAVDNTGVVTIKDGRGAVWIEDQNSTSDM